MTTQSVEYTVSAQSFSGLLDELAMGRPQSWGLLDMVPLLPTEQRKSNDQFVPPLQQLHLVRVHSYGTLELENTAHEGVLIAPMHVGFFQPGAQNHATSRILLLDANEHLVVDDCFCIQQSQGGYLAEAQQRFIVLPLGLRRVALERRGEKAFARLWEDIDAFNRRYGIARGGHLERFLRPNFHRLVPLRHAFEVLPQQVGAAYFVAGRLVGVEITPNAAYWSDVGPILTMYCYGAAALQGERHQFQSTHTPLDLDGLANLDDLARRLQQARSQDEATYRRELKTFAQDAWKYSPEEGKKNLEIMSLASQEWMGQIVWSDKRIVYLSVFRDLKD
jgi:hypothetical protein